VNLPFIVCDTDFLIKISTAPLPKFAAFLSEFGYELATLPKIVSELNGLTLSTNVATARKAKSALQTIQDSAVKVLKYDFPISEKTDADAMLVEFSASSRDNVVIATLDHSLLSILEKRRLPYLTLSNDRPVYRSF
jgi:rRNA-processing protein FCF1